MTAPSSTREFPITSFGSQLEVNSHILVVATAGSIGMPGPFTQAFFYHPLGGQFVPLGTFASNEGFGATMFMSRSEAFVGFPFTRVFSIGSVVGYRFKETHSRFDPD